MKLKDKIVIVTGASRGIGRAICELFAYEGAKLITTAKNNADSLSSIKGISLGLKVNLSNENDLEKLVSATIKKFNRIDVLVNNAGTFEQVDFEKITKSSLDKMLDINLKGPFLLTQKVIPYMKSQRSGKIINIVSGAGKMGSSKASHYASAKAGIIALTKSLAKAYGCYSININSIAPGFIDTDMIKDLLESNKKEIESTIPLSKIGVPKDVANLALFLASNDSNYITGQTINVDGGHCMKL
ncbi:MAG: SDR family oxidoreductase [Candidatus Omnitrophica bacterium]|nr:SDR family oxidoreductase [Candidatus Omnitrophota bacterium]